MNKRFDEINRLNRELKKITEQTHKLATVNNFTNFLNEQKKISEVVNRTTAPLTEGLKLSVEEIRKRQADLFKIESIPSVEEFKKLQRTLQQVVDSVSVCQLASIPNSLNIALGELKNNLIFLDEVTTDEYWKFVSEMGFVQLNALKDIEIDFEISDDGSVIQAGKTYTSKKVKKELSQEIKCVRDLEQSQEEALEFKEPKVSYLGDFSEKIGVIIDGKIFRWVVVCLIIWGTVLLQVDEIEKLLSDIVGAWNLYKKCKDLQDIPSPQSLANVVIVNQKKANVRKEPNSKAEIVAVVSSGMNFEVLENGSYWYKIKYDKTHNGWISKRSVGVGRQEK